MGRALIGSVRQFCCATLLIGIAVPLAWLLRIPSGLLQLEKTSLARWAWNFFLSLGVCIKALFSQQAGIDGKKKNIISLESDPWVSQK